MARSYTAEELKFIGLMYRHHPLKRVTELFNFAFDESLTFNQIKGAVKNNKIKSGRTGRFEKGQTPWTATPEGRKAMKTVENKGRFTKGHTVHNKLPVGAIVPNRDGYLNRKIAEPNVWKMEHVYQWEKVNGEVKDGHVLRFKDGDKKNCDVSNLMQVSYADNARLNAIGYNKLQEEVKDSAILLVKLQGAISDKKKRK